MAFPTIKTTLAAGIAVAVGLSAGAATAAEKIKLAASHKGSWSQAIPIYAQQQGFFKDEGLEVEIIWTRGGSDAQQAIISGAVQIATQTGILGVVSAYAKGAPIRILGAAMTGSGGLYWYVRSDSPLKSLADAKPSHSMGFSRPGSSTNLVAAALKAHYDSKIELTPTGGPTGTLTQVMSKQIDVGWASPPFALKNLEKGEIRILAKGAEVPEVQSQTIRVHVANADWLEKNRETAKKAMRALWKATDWIYSNPEAIESYVKIARVDKSVAEKVRDEFISKKAHSFAPIGDMDVTIKQAIQFKRLEKPLTKAQIDDMVQIVYDPKTGM